MEYNFRDIEQKWQKYWAENETFKAINPGDNSPLRRRGAGGEAKKFYILDMFPYPSGAGLHVGHPLGYIASDIVARYKRLKGFNVLHPMGYDSFGLPAEQYAIQTGQHPAVTTEANITRFREQLDKMGFSFDWSREVKTSDPAFYKWTQWIFLKLFNSWYNPETNKAESIEKLIEQFEIRNSKFEIESLKLVSANCLLPTADWKSLSEKQRSGVLMNYRLAYLDEAYVNWCPALGTVLANDEVKDGVSERGGYPVERKLMLQWSLRITAYAERLLNDLEKIEWSESIKEAQKNWIGKSEGCSIRFRLTPSPSPKERGAEQGYETAYRKAWGSLKSFSRQNRKNQTEAEELLWENLRNNKLGFKIRRQHAIKNYIADFVCIENKIVIEIDGGYHKDQVEQDKGREFELEEAGFKIIRFTYEEVLGDLQKVLQSIESALFNALSFGEGLGKAETGDANIEVFTTRPDTIYGVTFMALAPENELVERITTPEYKKAVEEYISYAKNRSERERQADVKKVTGQFTGAYAEHPFSGEKIPIWVAEYVLGGYGTGAVMGVPAHDTRDFAFAKHFKLPIKKVIERNSPSPLEKGQGDEAECFDTYDGYAINSDFINNLQVKDAIKKIISEIEKRGLGKGQVNYRLRDAIFGRQRYWGEPIPIYYKNGIPYPVDEKDLPVVLPDVDKYLPTETGEPPLARAANWKYTPDPSQEGKSYPLETTTMPGWAGSSWYYLRYMDAKNDKEFASSDAINYWKDVDIYIGGAEHATGHLLYVRFWTKFLYDLGLVPITEPAKKLVNQGMIQGVSEKIISSRFQSSDVTVMDYDTGKAIVYYVISDKRDTAIYKEIYSYDYLLKKIEFERRANLKKSFEDYFEFESGFIKENININIVDKEKVLIEDLIRERKDLKDCIFFVADGIYHKNKFFDFKKIKDKMDNSIAYIYFNDFEVTERKLFLTTVPEVEKMSKSKWNVVNPDDIIEKYGADAFRMYEMFLGPLELSKPWNTNGITGVFNFLKKLWRLFFISQTPVASHHSRGETRDGDQASPQPVISEDEPTKAELKILHRTIKKVSDDIERLSFNTAVSTFMICVNELSDLKCSKRKILEPLVIALSPFAPHIAEELWQKLGHNETVTYREFPEWKEEYVKEDEFEYPVSINGKTRFKLNLSLTMSSDEVQKAVLSSDEVKKYLNGNSPKKVIVVPGRIVNIVV